MNRLLILLALIFISCVSPEIDTTIYLMNKEKSNRLIYSLYETHEDVYYLHIVKRGTLSTSLKIKNIKIFYGKTQLPIKDESDIDLKYKKSKVIKIPFDILSDYKIDTIDIYIDNKLDKKIKVLTDLDIKEVSTRRTIRNNNV